jgi:hypothetical protein
LVKLRVNEISQCRRSHQRVGHVQNLRSDVLVQRARVTKKPVTPVLGELGLSQPKAQNDASGPGARLRHQRLGITSVCATVVCDQSIDGWRSFDKAAHHLRLCPRRCATRSFTSASYYLLWMPVVSPRFTSFYSVLMVADVKRSGDRYIPSVRFA